MASGVDAFLTTQQTHQNYTNQIISDSKSLSDSLFQSLLLTTDIIQSAPITSIMKYLEFIFYGSIAVLICLLLLSQIFFFGCEFMKCRHCIHILGLFLFFATLASFAAWLILGFLIPISYSGCNYFEKSIQDPASFTSINQFI